MSTAYCIKTYLTIHLAITWLHSFVREVKSAEDMQTTNFLIPGSLSLKLKNVYLLGLLYLKGTYLEVYIHLPRDIAV